MENFDIKKLVANPYLEYSVVELREEKVFLTSKEENPRFSNAVKREASERRGLVYEMLEITDMAAELNEQMERANKGIKEESKKFKLFDLDRVTAGDVLEFVSGKKTHVLRTSYGTQIADELSDIAIRGWNKTLDGLYVASSWVAAKTQRK